MMTNKTKSIKEIKLEEWKKLSHKEKIESLIVSHKIKDDPVSQEMLKIITKKESEADALYLMKLDNDEYKIKQEKEKIESFKHQENARLDNYRYLYMKLTHEEKIEYHVRRYTKKEDRDAVREMLKDEADCNARFERSLDQDRKYTLEDTMKLSTSDEEEDKDNEKLAKPLEISQLLSSDGDIFGIVKLKSGNFGLGAYSFDKKRWVFIDVGVGKYLHPQYGISRYDDDMIEQIKEDMTEEMVENEVYHKYFKKVLN